MQIQELEAVQKRKDKLSPLMRLKGKAKAGAVVNACPYGCEDFQLDEHGYCRHLVGFTNDQKSGLMEPMALKNGRRVVQMKMVKDEDRSVEGEPPVMKPTLVPIPAGATFVQITTSSRVYHNEKKPAE